MSKKHQVRYAHFQGELGSHAEAAQTAKRQDPGYYPAASACYKGLYVGFNPTSKEGKIFLSGAEGIIGTELSIRKSNGGLDVFTHDNRHIGVIEKKYTSALSELLDLDWVIRCRLAYTLYVAEAKSFSAQLACFCYAPWVSEAHKEALERFITNMTYRISGVSHPGLELNQEQFNKVIDSRGEWHLTKDKPWPELPKGYVYYRRRRTYKDNLIGVAIKGNKGCLIASWAATFLIIAAATYAIVRFFLSA